MASASLFESGTVHVMSFRTVSYKLQLHVGYCAILIQTMMVMTWKA